MRSGRPAERSSRRRGRKTKRAAALPGDPAQRRLHDDGVRGRGAGDDLQQAAAPRRFRIMMQVHTCRATASAAPIRTRSRRPRSALVHDLARERRLPAARQHGRGARRRRMFSRTVEMVLNVAAREARRRAATRTSRSSTCSSPSLHDPRARRSCAPAGADPDAPARGAGRASWTTTIERLPAGVEAGARADARLPARAADGRAARAERGQDRGRRRRHPGRAPGRSRAPTPPTS